MADIKYTAHSSLTTAQVIECFPEECKTLLPMAIRTLRKSTKPYFDAISGIKLRHFDQVTETYLLGIAKFHEPKEDIAQMQRLERIRLALDAPNDGRITEDDIRQAREMPILPLYDFQNVRPGLKRWHSSCPWHKDRRPSFACYDGSRYVCFSCGSKGTAIDFVMKRDGVKLPQAVKILLNK